MEASAVELRLRRPYICIEAKHAAGDSAVNLEISKKCAMLPNHRLG